MATGRRSTLLAQGKERRLDGTGWPRRAQLAALFARRGIGQGYVGTRH